jgi:hypothetical protein
MGFSGPGRRGLGARGRPGPGGLASEATRLPACLLGKRTGLLVVPKRDRKRAIFARFHQSWDWQGVYSACARAETRRAGYQPQCTPP